MLRVGRAGTFAVALFVVAVAGQSRAIGNREVARPRPAEPGPFTMTKMRLAGTLLQDARRQTGAYPRADTSVHLLADVIATDSPGTGTRGWLDGWGNPLRYRARRDAFEVISYGSDGVADIDYVSGPLFPGRYWQIADAPDARSDLVLIDGRFVKRPFGSRKPEFETINAINTVFIAAASFSVDNNRFPGDAYDLVPVSTLAADLVPIYIRDLPTLDGWGRALLYANTGRGFLLASYGEDGLADRYYYPDLICDHGWPAPGPSETDGGDVIQMCGEFAYWPRGTEP